MLNGLTRTYSKWVVGLMVSAVLLAIAGAVYQYRRWETQQWIWEAQFYDLHARPQSLKIWRGQPLIINFWATWCVPCVKEMPMLSEFAQSHPHIRVVGIGLDTQANMLLFSQRLSISYPLWAGGITGLNLQSRLGNTQAKLPYTVALDRDGYIVFSKMGQLTPEELKEIF